MTNLPALREAVAKPTPYYSHAGITIYHGDCRDILPHVTADVVVTDPPYGVGIDYASYDDNAANTAGVVADFVDELVGRVRCVAFTAGRYETELWLYRNFPPRWRMCWYKGAQSTASPIGFNDWEAVLIYGDHVHNHAHDWFYAMPEQMGRFGHPCPKPVGYGLALIGRLSKPSDIILDPFMGSGTTLVAAKQLGRKAIGIEIEERYCEIAVKRLAQEVLPLTPIESEPEQKEMLYG